MLSTSWHKSLSIFPNLDCLIRPDAYIIFFLCFQLCNLFGSHAVLCSFYSLCGFLCEFTAGGILDLITGGLFCLLLPFYCDRIFEAVSLEMAVFFGRIVNVFFTVPV